MNLKLTGLVAAPFTPLTADGRLNPDMIDQLAHSLDSGQVRGAFVCGTTGEGLSLSTEERMEVAGKWKAAASANLSIIVHVGHPALPESRRLAAHAAKIGAAAFATLAPIFYRATTTAQLVDYCAGIASAAPELPFFYYHIPAMAGADLPMIEFLQLASGRIPNLAGIKFTHENLMDYSRCLQFEGGRFNILFGRDEILLAALALGATGAVGSTYNYMPEIYHRVISAFASGDLDTARRGQAQAVEIISIMSRRGGLPAAKAMMKLIGLDCGPVRSPLSPLSPETLDLLTRELAEAGFPS